jgi:uncharacterized membrane protein HdeD (DUF308 family)
MTVAATLGVELAREVKRASIWYIILGVVMVAVGVFALARPMVAGLALTAVVGWVLILAGAMQVVHCFMARSGGGFVFRLVLGLLYVLGGSFILNNLHEGLAALTVVLGFVILTGGILRILVGRAMTGVPGVGWVLFSGVASVVLAILIFVRLPSSSEFIIGLFVGLDLIFGGWSMISVAMSARQVADVVVDVAAEG